MLISVTKSKGTKRLYEYQGSLMTAVRDEHGQVLVRNTYDGTALASQHYANGDEYHFHYRWNQARTNAVMVDVLLPNQTTRSIPVADSVSQF
jgi:hypothetical protein